MLALRRSRLRKPFSPPLSAEAVLERLISLAALVIPLPRPPIPPVVRTLPVRLSVLSGSWMSGSWPYSFGSG